MSRFVFLPLICSIAYVTPTFSAESPHTGIHFGALGQYANGTAKIDGLLTQPTKKIADIKDITVKGFGGGIFANIGFVTNNTIYFGPEIYGSFSGADGDKPFQVAPVNNTIKVALLNTIGFKVKGGAIFGQLLAYGLLGVSSAQWEVESTERSSETPVKKEVKKRATGFEIGAGFAMPAGIINDNFLVGGEYSFTKFEGKKINIRHDALELTKIKPEVHTISVKVSYRLTGDLWPGKVARVKESL